MIIKPIEKDIPNPNNLFLMEEEENPEFDSYDALICEIGLGHLNGEMKKFEINDPKRNKMLEYINSHKRQIKWDLFAMDFSFYEKKFLPLNFMVSLIKGEPYFQYFVDETTSEDKVRIYYYLYLLKSQTIISRECIKGEYYNIRYHVLGCEITVSDNKNILFEINYTSVTPCGFTTLEYIVRF